MEDKDVMITNEIVKIKNILWDEKKSSDDLINQIVQISFEAGKQEGIREIWDKVICPMCYRLNPQHATMDNGNGCHYCEEKENWCGQALKSRMGEEK